MGPFVSNTEPAGVLHASIAGEVLDNNGGNEFVRAQDEVTLFYQGTQEEKLLDNKKGSVERPGIA